MPALGGVGDETVSGGEGEPFTEGDLGLVAPRREVLDGGDIEVVFDDAPDAARSSG